MIAKPISALELHYPMIQFLIIAELSHARRASGAPWVRKWSNLPIRGNLVITWPYTDRPTDRPPKRPSVCTTGMPMFTLTLCSYFGSPLIAHQCCDQLTAVKTRYPLTSITWPYRGLRCRPIQVEYFLKFSADKLLVFKWPQAHSFIHMKYVVFMSLWPSTIKILISNWPRTRKFSQLFKNASKEDRCFKVLKMPRVSNAF